MTVRTKYLCTTTVNTANGVKTVTLVPIPLADSADNTAAFVPGTLNPINLSKLLDAAATDFVPGRQFFVDFTWDD